jgi:hypothetical protein
MAARHRQGGGVVNDLTEYIATLKAEDRSLAREYGDMPSTEFQARLGPAVDRIIDRLDATAPRNGMGRVASIRVGDIAKWVSGAVVAGIALFIRQQN